MLLWMSVAVSVWIKSEDVYELYLKQTSVNGGS